MVTPEGAVPVGRRDSAQGWSRAPALFASVPFALGILTDSLCSFPVLIWLACAGLFLLSAPFVLWKGHPLCAACLLSGLFAWGGYSHRAFWQSIERHPLVSQLSEEPLRVRLRVRLLESPSYRQPSDREFTPLWKTSGRSSFPAECLSWNGERPVSGRVTVNVSGQLIGPQAGDVVEILGTIRTPAAPRNPGEFDFRTWSLRRRLLAIVSAEHPRQVTVVEHRPLGFRNALPRLRARLVDTFVHNLDDPAEAGIASTLILGDRSHLPFDVKRSFLRSGAFHLLAISGLHIGLIAFLLTRLFGWLNCSVRQSALATIVILIVYAFLTGLRPSVLRATIFLVIYLGSQLYGRSAHRVNSLGLTVLILLLLNPTNLFDSGAQLSFLAVTAIFAVSPLLSSGQSERALIEQAGQGLDPGPLKRSFVKLKQLLADGFLIGGAVWIFTFPVAARNFHLLPVWGIPLTILLIPFVSAALVTGWCYLICAGCLPMLIPLIEPLLHAVLFSIRWSVETAAALPGSGGSLATTSAWWNVGYLAGIVSLLTPPLRLPHLWKVMIGWICLHLLVSHTASVPDETDITFYSVGHGLAVLMEFPDETRILYDCGSHDGGPIAASAILADLRERSITHLDRIYLSHADLDHYSALPDLIGELEISEIVSTDALIGSEETNLINLRRNLPAAGCQLRAVDAGTFEKRSSDISIEVLHPPRGTEFSSDNAASLVLYVRCRGVGVLMTGDLEDEGLSSLLAQNAPVADILLAPHHGSLAANPRQLSNWCEPRYVVISSGYRVQLQQLESIYSRSERVLCTERDGAVRFSISAEGTISVETFRDMRTVRKLNE